MEFTSFQNIEKKWQQTWKNTNADLSSIETNKEKMYILEMLPYPSGNIHMGHVRNYTIGDVIARYFKLHNKSIFHPIGWDSFGLPAENAAIDRGINPADWTYKNIEDMKEQIQLFGISYDWGTEIKTCSPEYYRWNQWLFREMYKKGLAYKKYAKVNFCPSCQTVLANEQVINGECWRCSSLVESKHLSQWYLKITQYAQPLLEQHSLLKGHWPDRVLNMQEKWIGKSEGTEIIFPVRGYNTTITVFTTKPETFFGVTYLALAAEHPFIQELINKGNFPEIEMFVKEVSSQTEQERTHAQTPKKGIHTGFFAIQPLTEQEIPIYIANFVLADYGHGAVMGVPSHDQRDMDFAQTYDIPLKIVIDSQTEFQQGLALPAKGKLINSEQFNGLTEKEAAIAITKALEEKKSGKTITQYKLRDWLISRQRYWGTPIPIINCDSCGTVLVPEKDLPVLLPDDISFQSGGNPILSSPTFIHTTCPDCGKKATRETDTMDTFFDSSWYFLRYTDPHNTNAIVDKSKSQHWLPVDYYIGGIEHAVMHLLYARFFFYIFRELGFVNAPEPFKNLITQGMVLANSYYCSECRIYYYYKDIQQDICPVHKTPIIKKMEKMSKSKNNGIAPEGLLNEYGVDAARLFMLFAAPIDRDLEWNEQGLLGCSRFLKRIMNYTYTYAEQLKNISITVEWDNLDDIEKNLMKKLHQTIFKVSQDMKDFSYNTVVATLMEFLNTLESFKPHNQSTQSYYVCKNTLQYFSIMLFPLAPHMAEEIYQSIGGTHESIAKESFPTYNSDWIVEQNIPYTIQINGKMKLSLMVDKNISQKELEKQVLETPIIKKSLQDKNIVKTIFVNGKILNYVVK